MKRIDNHKQLVAYLQAHYIEDIFTETLMEHLSLNQFEQGEIICAQGDPSQYLHILVKGKIKIHTTSSEGKKLILAFKTPLEVVGDIEYVQNIDLINTVEAVSPVSMISIHYDWLKKYGSDHPPFLKFLLEIITNKFHVKSNSLSFNLLYPVEVRLASYLLSISYDEEDVHFRGHLRTSNLRDVADLIGTSYRHLNRVIHQLCTVGLIERNKEGIVVKNRDGLRVLASRNIYE